MIKAYHRHLTLQRTSSVGYRVSLCTYSYYLPSSYYLAIKWKIKAPSDHHLEQLTDVSAVPIACPQKNAQNCPRRFLLPGHTVPSLGWSELCRQCCQGARPCAPLGVCYSCCLLSLYPVAVRPHCLDFSGMLLMVQKFQML